jgi:putative glutamine amidotransferase
MSRRPLIAIPARFSESASALRYRAIVTARTLAQAVHDAGGEPLTVLPSAPGGRVSRDEVADRLAFADGVLLPGGGDIHPARYGEVIESGEVYDVDEEQDGFDFAVAQWALGAGVPLLAVCRGLHVVDVALGGTLEQDMAEPHRHHVHELRVADDSLLHGIVGASMQASCFHHQRVAKLGEGMRASAWAKDGGVEAVELEGGRGWFLGVQWHPEDTFTEDPTQRALVGALVAAAAARVDAGEG